MNLAHYSNLKMEIDNIAKTNEEGLELLELILEEIKLISQHLQKMSEPKNIFVIKQEVLEELGFSDDQIKKIREKSEELSQERSRNE